MAMLAEPRRKQKFGTDPRNTFWSNDGNKFGQRMLEKMGWTQGKGLGANENGRTHNVTAVFKARDDVRGVGCTKKCADSWIAHQDDFDALLQALNQQQSQKNETGEEKPLVLSLEAKSKSSRSRVHYHKLTRGKDLSSKSSDDLNCIFGRKTIQSSQQSTPNISGESSDDSSQQSLHSESTSNDTSGSTPSETREHHHGVITVTSSSSIQEYFAQKMQGRMKQQNADIVGFLDSTSNKPTEEHQEASLQTDKHRKRKGDIANMDSIASLPKKKKKKKSRQKDIEDESTTCRMPVDIHEPEHSVIRLKKKKKHKKRHKEAEEGEAGQAVDCPSLKGGEMVAPGSDEVTDTDRHELEQIPGSNLGSIKGCGKSKRKDIEDESSTCRIPVDIHELEYQKKKKHKKKPKEAEEGKAGQAIECSSVKGGEIVTPGSGEITDTDKQELEQIPGSNLGSIKGCGKSKRKDIEDESSTCRIPVDIHELEYQKKKKHKKKPKEAEEGEAGHAIECSSLKGGEIVTPGSGEITDTDKQELEKIPGSNLGSIKGYGKAEGAEPGQAIDFSRRKRLVRFSLEGGEVVAPGFDEVTGTDRQKLEQFPGSNLGSIKGYGN